MKNSSMKQIIRDEARADYLMSRDQARAAYLIIQLENSETIFQKLWFGVQALFFNAKIQIRYKDEYERCMSQNKNSKQR